MSRPRYTLDELLAESDYSQPLPTGKREWVDAPAVALPEGYRRAYGSSANWTLDELIQTQWLSGAGTMGDPSLCQWDSDWSVLLKHVDGAPPRSDVLQLNKPAKATRQVGRPLHLGRRARRVVGGVAKMQILCSVEHHGGWAGWSAEDYAGAPGCGSTR